MPHPAPAPRTTFEERYLALAKRICLTAIPDPRYEPALDLIADRNTCSHIYKQSLIPGVLARLPAHAGLMQAIFARLPIT